MSLGIKFNICLNVLVRTESYFGQFQFQCLNVMYKLMVKEGTYDKITDAWPPWKIKKSFQKLQPPLTWWHEMSKVEKNATVEVKVVKVDDEGGEFHTQVDTIPGLKS